MRLAFLIIAPAIRNRFLQFSKKPSKFATKHVHSKSLIWVTSKYLGSCWSYRKTKTTLLYQTTHSASYEPSYRSLRETFVK